MRRILISIGILRPKEKIIYLNELQLRHFGLLQSFSVDYNEWCRFSFLVEFVVSMQVLIYLSVGENF